MLNKLIVILGGGLILVFVVVGLYITINKKGTGRVKFHQNIIELAKKNKNFRQELATMGHSQVVLMSIEQKSEIGLETHMDVDQILIFVAGQGQAILDDVKSDIRSGDMVIVPAGTSHNFINTGVDDLKLFTIYAPAEHKPGTIHVTKADADKSEL